MVFSHTQAVSSFQTKTWYEKNNDNVRIGFKMQQTKKSM